MDENNTTVPITNIKMKNKETVGSFCAVPFERNEMIPDNIMIPLSDHAPASVCKIGMLFAPANPLPMSKIGKRYKRTNSAALSSIHLNRRDIVAEYFTEFLPPLSS